MQDQLYLQNDQEEKEARENLSGEKVNYNYVSKLYL